MSVRSRLLAVVGLLLATAAATAFGTAAPASAHTDLLGSSPADGQRVAVATDHVALEFESPLLAGAVDVRVSGADGASVATGAPRVTDTLVVVPVELSGPGRYDVAYRATATDGHPVTGSLSFTAVRDRGAVAGAGAGAAAGAGGTATQATEATGTTAEAVAVEEAVDAAATLPAPAPHGGGLGRMWLVVGAAVALIAVALHRAGRDGRAGEQR
jgi:methionine-rich copper-binding protein CopC